MADARPAAVERAFVVGDVHGCVDELAALLDTLGLGSGDAIVFVGDYVDRGPASRDVVDLLLDLHARPGIDTTFLRGNHEDMLLAYMGFPGLHGEAFLHNGGMETLASYRLHPLTPGQEVAAALPARHLTFLRQLGLMHTIGTVLVTHAGIDPARPLAAQREEDLLWIREPFISQPHPLPFTVCFGHTPRREVLFDLPYKIGLDTGCVYGNRLSCIELQEQRLLQVRRGQRHVTTKDLRPLFRAAGTTVRLENGPRAAGAGSR
jgi:serine/threonine protein phosphatase 1